MLLEIILPSSFSVPKLKAGDSVFSTACDDCPRHTDGESALTCVACLLLLEAC